MQTALPQARVGFYTMRLQPRFWGCLALFGMTALGAPSVAFANGRFPAAGQIALQPNDPKSVLVRTTFGLLLSRNTGKTLDWICERAVGYGGAIEDPAIALLGDGTITVAAFEGLSVSHDNGCSFGFIKGDLQGEYIVDVAVDRLQPSYAVVLTSTGSQQGFHVQVFETLDQGRTWQKAGGALGTDLLAQTIDAAPTRPTRLYVSGTVKVGTKDQGVIAVSDDRGNTWTRTTVELAGDSSLYIAAVDPTNPDLVYVRTTGNVADRLLVSHDGGKSFAAVAQVDGSMLGFAISPDGSRIAMGGPTVGLLVASRTDMKFIKQGDAKIKCLAWGAAGLYACGDDYTSGFIVGRSLDEGRSWVPLLAKLSDVQGPSLVCNAQSSPYNTMCPRDWVTTVASVLGVDTSSGAGASGSAGVTSNQPMAQGGLGGVGSDSAASGGAGGISSPTHLPQANMGGGAARANANASGGAGCHWSRSSMPSIAALLACAFALGGYRMRSRRARATCKLAVRDLGKGLGPLRSTRSPSFHLVTIPQFASSPCSTLSFEGVAASGSVEVQPLVGRGPCPPTQ